jgi:hypothetical protein
MSEFSPNKVQQFLDGFRWLREWSGVCESRRGLWFLMMEDDFELCPELFSSQFRRVVEYMTARAYDAKNFRGLRVAPGLNGLFLRCDDAREIAKTAFFRNKDEPLDYLIASQQKLRPDIVTFKRSLMRHLGDVSTVGNDKAKYVESAVPSCSMLLTSHGSMQTHEWFNVDECCDYLFSPCGQQRGADVARSFPAEREKLQGTPPPTFKAVAGDRAESCDLACARHGLTCNPRLVDLVNQCTIMDEVLGCDKCGKGIAGYDQPARDGRKCILQPCDMFKCSAFHVKTERICPCS